MFWDNFYNACLKNGIKPNPLAKELKISSGSLTAWKNGGIPNGETLLKISKRLNVSTDYLLGITDKPNGNNDNMQIGAETPNYGTTTNEMVKIFNELSFSDKAKVMSLVAELSEKKGA